ncbi:MAG: RNA polymerase sigma factor SigZ [SAR324 cluster bacterium]|nr:RNA polymerase sigma factor SigZ [SAR324 cluster bacterium]
MQTIEKIWQEYHSKLFRFVNRQLGDSSLSDDIVQDIMIKINSKIDTLQSDQKLPGWIYQIARNTLIDYYRSNKPQIELPQNLASPELDPVQEARREIGECLDPFIKNLPTRYREAITLSEMEGLTQKELASQQNISLSGAKSRVQRGRKLLKEMLMECCHFEMDHRQRLVDFHKKRECAC